MWLFVTASYLTSRSFPTLWVLPSPRQRPENLQPHFPEGRIQTVTLLLSGKWKRMLYHDHTIYPFIHCLSYALRSLKKKERDLVGSLKSGRNWKETFFRNFKQSIIFSFYFCPKLLFKPFERINIIHFIRILTLKDKYLLQPSRIN